MPGDKKERNGDLGNTPSGAGGWEALDSLRNISGRDMRPGLHMDPNVWA